MKNHTKSCLYAKNKTGAKDKAVKIFSNIIIAVLCLSYICPFVWVFYNSLKDKRQFAKDILGFPMSVQFDNYTKIFTDEKFYYALRNSLFNTVISIACVLIMSFTIAYFLSRYRFRGRNLIYMFFLLGMVVPVHALLIPIYIQFTEIGINNRFFTLLIPYITFALPRDIYLFDSYMKGVPKSIEEAAFIDGATRGQLMRQVMFPICKPISATVIILDFITFWNEFPFSLVLVDSSEFRTIPIWLTNYQSQYSINVPGRLATMMLAMAPLIILYLFFNEKMMKGMVAGAVKG